MKSKVSCLLVGVFLVAGSVAAQAAQFGDLTYESSGTEVTITGYTGPGGAVTIPESINGLLVTGIGGWAFAGTWGQPNANLSNVVIPDSVTGIGAGAFWCCSSLTSITIPNSVTSIGGGAFCKCTSLTNAIIGNGVKSLESYHSGHNGGPDFTFGSFEGCTNLLGVTIGNGVTNMRQRAFAGCSSLASVSIPQSVTSIESAAFRGCSSLTSITIPHSVTNIGAGAFSDCTALMALTVDTNNACYCSLDGVLFDMSQTALLQCPGSRAEDYAVPNGVTSIGSLAFSGCWSLTGISIPDSVTNIGDGAFFGCTSLTAIEVDPTNPSYSSLDGVLFNKSQTTLVQYPGGKEGAYAIPDSVTSIGWAAFCGCSSLTSITIPNGVTALIETGEFAPGVFEGCISLTNVTIGSSVTHVGGRAFWGCTSLTAAYFEGNAPTVGSGTFGYADVAIGYADKAIIYYLPGTIGWEPTYAERPTAPWVLPYPTVLTTAPNFGIQTNQFGFRISWATNASVVVEASADLGSWSSVSTNTLIDGWSYFRDPQWTNHPARFYRLRSP